MGWRRRWRGGVLRPPHRCAAEAVEALCQQPRPEPAALQVRPHPSALETPLGRLQSALPPCGTRFWGFAAPAWDSSWSRVACGPRPTESAPTRRPPFTCDRSALVCIAAPCVSALLTPLIRSVLQQSVLKHETLSFGHVVPPCPLRAIPKAERPTRVVDSIDAHSSL